ncbi:hypothetical protein [Achromobacter insuavis]|uniref:hypothetical protein n=1 Tax=Achromobacter insuavis TaxID=1287735 RepID=UPI001F147DEB|nr:hypothetical protein [Achromobacter insuavis]
MTSAQICRPNISTITDKDWTASNYNLAIFALGFESRAISFLNEINFSKKKAFAFGFDHGHNEIYKNNLSSFHDAEITAFESLSDENFEQELNGSLSVIADDSRQNIFVDVSCFTRFRLAAIVHRIFSIAQNRKNELIVDFVYALANFEKPNTNRHPNITVGPAHPAFAGWSQGNYSSTATVLGLGYEQDQAMGVVEYLQAGEVWAFAPNSPVKDYKPEVDNANALLLSEIPLNHVIEYDVCAPVSAIATLESVVRGLSVEHSVVLVPFGPKIFVLCALIVAAIRQDVAVWRASQGNRITPHDRTFSGVKVGMRLAFQKPIQ